MFITLFYIFLLQVDSYVCIARRFCKVEFAIAALMEEQSLTRAEAEEVTDYTHNTSEIAWRSCSCAVNCWQTNNCCEDAESVAVRLGSCWSLFSNKCVVDV